MVDLAVALVKHLQNDAAVVAQIGSADRILTDFNAGTELPAMAAVVRPGGGASSSAVESAQVTFLIRAKPDQRDEINAVLARLKVLFNDLGNYTVGSSPADRYVVFSQARGSPRVDKEKDQGAQWGRAEYRFFVTT